MDVSDNVLPDIDVFEVNSPIPQHHYAGLKRLGHLALFAGASLLLIAGIMIAHSLRSSHIVISGARADESALESTQSNSNTTSGENALGEVAVGQDAVKNPEESPQSSPDIFSTDLGVPADSVEGRQILEQLDAVHKAAKSSPIDLRRSR